MRKIVSFVIGTLVAGSRVPAVSKKATLPLRAISTTAPGMTRLSTSALITSMSRCRRSEDSPTCSGLALGRLWAKAAPVVTTVKSAASSKILAFMGASSFVEPGSCERWELRVRGRHASSASVCRQARQARRKYRPTLTSLALGSILQSSWGCSSVGRAQGWQSWGQGFEPPQLHQIFTRGYGAGRDPAFVCGCAGVASGHVQAIHRRLICARYQVAVNVDRHLEE